VIAERHPVDAGCTKPIASNSRSADDHYRKTDFTLGRRFTLGEEALAWAEPQKKELEKGGA
jgi:hypothetical protein